MLIPASGREPREEFVVGFSLCFILGTVSASVETNLHPCTDQRTLGPRKHCLWLFVCGCVAFSGKLCRSSSQVERRAPRIASAERNSTVNVPFSVSHPGRVTFVTHPRTVFLSWPTFTQMRKAQQTPASVRCAYYVYSPRINVQPVGGS